MIRVYLTGASGSGKTTLAKYISETFGLMQLPSISRVLMSRMGLTDKDFGKLLANKDEYTKFQRMILTAQFNLEEDEEYREKNSFVSDRCVDHVIYGTFGSGLGPYYAVSDDLAYYVEKLKKPNSIVFFVRPTRECWRAAVEEGRRLEFLDWDDMMRFDGALQLYLDFNDVQYVSIRTADMEERKKIVTPVIKFMLEQ